MGNTQSGTSNPNIGLYDQYINEQKRIIAAQQQQIQNLSTMYLNQTTQQNTPSNILLQQMNTNQNNHQQPVGSTNNIPNMKLPQIENNNIIIGTKHHFKSHHLPDLINSNISSYLYNTYTAHRQIYNPGYRRNSTVVLFKYKHYTSSHHTVKTFVYIHNTWYCM